MSLKRLLRYLANEEFVEQLANTPVVRRGAQLTHYVYQKGMKKLTDISEAGKTSSGQLPGEKPMSLSSFTRTFARNLQKEIDKEMKK